MPSFLFSKQPQNFFEQLRTGCHPALRLDFIKTVHQIDGQIGAHINTPSGLQPFSVCGDLFSNWRNRATHVLHET